MRKPAIKILSIDGGGIRGIIPCTILSFIEQQTNRPISELFDLVAGTSTGGIITAGLCTPKIGGTKPHSAEEMSQLYLNNGKTIFGKRQNSRLVGWLGQISKTLGEILNKSYDETAIENLLNQYFGEQSLSDALLPIMITTYDLATRKPFYFSSRLAKEQKIDDNWLIREIVRSTSAAPTYFEPNIIERGGRRLVTVDGGVFANNPAILAYGEAKELWKQRQLTTTKGIDQNDRESSAVVQKSDDDLPFYMLSIGTGYRDQNDESLKDIERWSTRQWIKLLLTDVFMQGVAESTDYTMQHLLPNYEDNTPRYQRFNVLLNKDQTAMDDARQVASLKARTEAFIEEHRNELLTVCQRLTM